ncbi:ribosome maturation factor RimM [Novosphingobium sp. Fuku2-ISO-50]|uniref:ribosome maturation factor RimM n=1 Tax=Novosphingobium sp. Fuku2-ISO-50 TaxID=1739114 RepID=UPI00076DCA3D|nr:ribosome maturation factor RimM [Novosphingobium sp. Fuku2-ISO-50]KUR81251.1 ribosome maturation factor RimM [Novosphingobium sp. Fuku2-ISO-50]
MGTDRPVTLAAIAGAHGVAGEVRLKLFGDGVATLKRHLNRAGAFNGGGLTLTAVREDGKGGAIARLAECHDRNGAEALRGTALAVPRSALPPLGEGEYYYADLIGLPAVSTDGADLGTCIAVENFGAGDVLEVRRPDGKTFMVPIRAEAVPEWDDTRLVIEAVWAED